MHYLSDIISISRNFTYAGAMNTSLSYRVYIKPSGTEDTEYSLIYIGHIFVTGDVQTIYLNDIIATHMYDHKYIQPSPRATSIPASWGDEKMKVYIDVKVTLGDEEDVRHTTYITNVLQYYKDYNSPRGTEIDPSQAAGVIHNVLNQRTNYLPRVPRLAFQTDNFWIGALLIGTRTYWNQTTDGEDTILRFVGVNENSVSTDSSTYNDVLYITNTDMPISVAYNVNGSEYHTLTQNNILATEIGVAQDDDSLDSYKQLFIIDECPAPYYLVWMDRTGAYQCQPFTKKARHTENISSNNIINNINRTRPVVKSVTDTWTLNSDWLDKEAYIAHESILTSPYLYLYNTQTDEGRWVNCADASWVEPSKDKPTHMTVTLTAIEPQNILY